MRISSITVNNYRAFFNDKGEEKEKHHIGLPRGENLFLYGENGSGKSSLYRALKDLFISAVDTDCRIPQNVFSREIELSEEPFVKIAFSQSGEENIQWTFSSDPHLTNTRAGGGDIDLLKSVVRAKSFMTYRDLLRVHFVQGPEVNLFDFLFGREGLLSDLQNPTFSRQETSLRMSALYMMVLQDPDEINQSDFVNGVNEIMKRVNVYLNAMLRYFDESMSVSFSVLTGDSLIGGQPVLRAEVEYFGVSISQQEDVEGYHHFLNEARLSALAICIFLSANLSVPASRFQMLFLDDIFTGLDTSNRFPLLEILTDRKIGETDESFANHQIFLTTYDRQWFELARNHMDPGKWVFSEIYVDRHTKKFDQPAIMPVKSDLDKATHYFRTKQYPACANHQRKICEQLIKRFLPENLKYDAIPDGGIVPVTKLSVMVDRLKIYLEENGLSFSPFLKLKNSMRVVMNPLSHDDPDSPVFRREIEDVFKIIDELGRLKNEIIVKPGKMITMKKNNGKNGLLRTYVCELTTPVRILRHGDKSVVPAFRILPISQKDGQDKKKYISYGGTFETVYGRFCHSLGIEPAKDPLTEFTIEGKPFNDLFK